jgi:hypothetical protein
MGNIDEEGSEAYRRFGAGRGKAERTPEEDRAATPVVRETAKLESPAAARLTAAGMAAGERQPSGDASMAEMYSGPRTKPIVADQPKPGGRKNVDVQASKPSAPAKSAPAKTSAYPMTGAQPTTKTYERKGGVTADAKTSAYPMKGAQPTTKTYDRSGGPTADELANYKPPAKLTKKQQIEQEIDSIKPTAEQTQKGLETASAMAGGVGLKALQSLAKKLATPKMAKYSQKALPAPTKRLTYDKAGMLARKRAERAEARKSEMLKENAKRYGLDESSPGYEAAAGAVKKGLGGKDFALKKGGSVKREMPMKKMASGGSVSNPSKRADGIATKGKTRCKMR